MCPHNPQLIAYVTNGDIFVIGLFSTQVEVQLTFTVNEVGVGASRTKSAGYPSYITQEEFNRFQGFWWKPVNDTGGEL